MLSGFGGNHPTCRQCGGASRPSILMLSDSGWVDDVGQAEQWAGWRTGLMELARTRAEQGGRTAPLKVAIVEVGAGGNVTTIRNLGETLVEELAAVHASPTLLRINPDLPLADQSANQVSLSFTRPWCGAWD